MFGFVIEEFNLFLLAMATAKLRRPTSLVRWRSFMGGRAQYLSVLPVTHHRLPAEASPHGKLDG